MNRLYIRWRWSAIATMGLTGVVAVRAWAESYPYTARIVVPAARVQSGPGDSFYSTDTLTEGQDVQVYSQRQDGWCAIRPPQESFSWVFGSHLRLLGDSLAEVDKEDVASRIGSRVSRKRNAVQVRLKKGELVQLLGEATEGGKKWYKIAPPAGEFRWIRATEVQPVDQNSAQLNATRNAATDSLHSDEVVEVQAQDSEASAAIETTSATGETTAEAQSSKAAPTPAVGAESDWRPVPIAPPLAAAGRNGMTVAASDSTRATDDSSAALPVQAVGSPAPAASTKLPTSGALSDDLARQLTDLELRLSRMVAEPPATWQTAPLVQDAKRLLAQLDNPADQRAIQITVDKVGRFAVIQQRYQQIEARNSPMSVSEEARANITPVPSASDPARAAAMTDGGRYDAIGVLRPVVSKRPGAPQFALIDGRGQVVSFVSATPDVNLQPYLGRRVGVIGNRGFIPEFHRAHVTAGRVMPLDERIVR
jgi:hypothetical protein